jgi:LysM repeat protein
LAEEARGWPESWRQEPPWVADTTVELETVETSDPIEFGTALIGELVQDAASMDLRGGRSQLGTTCPFFRRETADGTLGRPIEMPESINRCAAYGEPRPQSLRQQQLVCLSSRHVDCPRYLRAATPLRVPPARRLTRAILAAITLLLLSAAASFAFVLARGGLMLPGVPGATGAVAAAVGTPAPSTGSVVPTPAPSMPPSEAPTATPTASPVTTPAASPEPTTQSTAPPVDENDRYALLEPCPDKPDCYIYKVRHGDTLTGIAKYFGTTLATVRELNPWTKTKGIQPGQELFLPPPPR